MNNPSITIYSKPNCSFCDMAKKMLKHRDMPFEEKVLDVHYTKQWLTEQYPTAQVFPVIVWDGYYIGGSKELRSKLTEVSLNEQLLNE